MKNPFAKDDKYEKLKEKLLLIIQEYEKIYGKGSPYYEIANWLCADLVDLINEIESE
jgi:hypothetical protein